MDKLKSEKRVFTGAVFGWDNQKDGTMKPNWKEQETIDMMRYFYHEKKQSFSFIAKWLNANDVKESVVESGKVKEYQESCTTTSMLLEMTSRNLSGF